MSTAPASPAAAARLSLHGEATCLAEGAPGQAGQPLAPGIDDLLRRHFAAPAGLALAMESAIADIEDALARVPTRLHRASISSSDPYLRQIAHAAGLDDKATAISREAVEQVFGRLSAVALGRPAAFEGLPDTPQFAAALLLVRELMHHLDIRSIRLDHGA